MQNRQIPIVSNAVQSSERMRNSLGLIYESGALPTELCQRPTYESWFQRVDQEFVMTYRAALR